MIRQFQNLPIRAKIFSVFVLVLLLFSFFNFAYFPWKQNQQVTNALRDRAESVAQMLVAGVSLTLVQGDYEFVNRLFMLAKRDESILYIAICDENGQPNVSFNPKEMSIPSIAAFSSDRTIERADALHTMAQLETMDTQWALIIGFSLKDRDSAIDEIRITGFLVSFATLIFCLLLSIYLSRLIINPLSQLVDRIGLLGKTEDPQIFIEKGHNDEVGKLIDAFSEMTARLQARTVERKQALDTLRESEERFRTLVQTAGSVILVMSPDHRILEWNHEAERIYGRRREEVLGRDYFELFLPEQEREAVGTDLGKVLSGEPPRGFVNPVVGRDGTKRLLQWNTVRILDGEGQAIGIIACGQDITEQQHLEGQLRQSQKMEAVGQLTAGIAHNFNNALVGIMGNLELAIEDAAPPLRFRLQQAELSSERAAAIVKQLMAFSRASQSVESHPSDIHKIVDETVALCRVTFNRKIDIAIDACQTLPPILVDPDQIQQVFLNLLLNARDALEDGSTSDPRIEITMDVISSNEGRVIANSERHAGSWAPECVK